MNNGEIWDNFDKTELLPRAFEKLNEVFPEYKFTKKGNEWHSFWNIELTEQTTREDRTICSGKYYNFFDHQTKRNLIKRYQEMHGLVSYMAARIEICKKLEIQMPELTREESEKLQRKLVRAQKSRTTQEKLYQALFSPSGEYALEYLHGRGFTDKMIMEGQKKGGFGYMTGEILRELGEKENTGYKRDEQTGEIFYFAQKQNRVTIAFLSNNAFYFKFRSPRHGQEFENLRAFAERTYNKEHGQGEWQKLTANQQKNCIGNIEVRHIAGDMYPAQHLFNFQNCKFTNTEKEIILVEGEFDALSIRDIGGINNVCAIQGKDIREKQITEIFESPANAVCLCLDNDQAGKEGAEKIAYKIKDANKNYPSKQMHIYFLVMPERYKDANDYFIDKENNNGGTFRNLERYGFASYFFNKFWNEYTQSATENEGNSDKYFDDFRDKFISLYDIVDEIEKALLAETFCKVTGKIINAQIINEYHSKIAKAKTREEQKTKIKNAAAKFKEIADANDTDGAIKFIENEFTEIAKAENTAKFEMLLHPRTRANRLQSYREHPENIKTDYYFGYGTERVNGEIPSDALTIIAGKTSHGKSRMLINLALQIAYQNRYKEGRILYFCFEENTDKIEQKMLNTYIGENLNKRGEGQTNLQCIKDYFENEEPTAKYKYMAEDIAPIFRQLEDEFFRCFIDADGENQTKIQVINETRDITEITDIIEKINTVANGGVKAVFIDYIQLMHDEKHLTAPRNVELKIIAEQLNALANKYCIPIITGAQLKREVKNIGDFSPEQISDSSDIEKSADTIWMLWDSRKPAQDENDKCRMLKDKGFICGEGGKLYVEIVKSRNSSTGIYEVLELQPSTGRIFPSEYREKISDEIPREMFGREIHKKSTSCPY